MKLTLSIELKWWVEPYMYALRTFCFFTQLDPDYDKVASFIAKHGVKYEIANH